MGFVNILKCDKCGKEIADKEIFYYIKKIKKINSKIAFREKDLQKKITDNDFEGDVCKDCMIEVFFKDMRNE